MQTNVLLLDKIMGYIVRRKGKQVRPMFVFLTARTAAADPAGPLEPAAFRGAALIELLHTATLVHDDVVDETGAGTRRLRPAQDSKPRRARVERRRAVANRKSPPP
uniref:Probable solanesyl-diphosphate synthase 3, chloroplastic n=1 Tax=Tanacetum cinerariifolium TaxID=118510 RepID=A0A699WGW4_TANCI|nr:probable solanesyl-diphosphate synthase 3, chloroplastic [Tanacetum cinerariifolium]